MLFLQVNNISLIQFDTTKKKIINKKRRRNIDMYIYIGKKSTANH